MSKKVEVMTTISSVIDFIKQQIKVDITEANSHAELGLSREQLQKICYYAENSVTTSFIKASDQIESAIDR